MSKTLGSATDILRTRLGEIARERAVIERMLNVAGESTTATVAAASKPTKKKHKRVKIVSTTKRPAPLQAGTKIYEIKRVVVENPGCTSQLVAHALDRAENHVSAALTHLAERGHVNRSQKSGSTRYYYYAVNVAGESFSAPVRHNPLLRTNGSSVMDGNWSTAQSSFDGGAK